MYSHKLCPIFRWMDEVNEVNNGFMELFQHYNGILVILSSQNSIITLHGRWIILLKGEGSIYRSRVGEMDGQDVKMMRW